MTVVVIVTVLFMVVMIVMLVVLVIALKDVGGGSQRERQVPVPSARRMGVCPPSMAMGQRLMHDTKSKRLLEPGTA
jgi:hypothetical protein